MPVHQFATSQAAGAITPNLVSGELVEFIERPSRVKVLIAAEAAGETRIQVTLGGRTLLVESPVSRQNRVPIEPDDKLIDDIGMPGERLVIRGRNTGAGANVVFGRVEVTPLG